MSGEEGGGSGGAGPDKGGSYSPDVSSSDTPTSDAASYTPPDYGPDSGPLPPTDYGTPSGGDAGGFSPSSDIGSYTPPDYNLPTQLGSGSGNLDNLVNRYGGDRSPISYAGTESTGGIPGFPAFNDGSGFNSASENPALGFSSANAPSGAGATDFTAPPGVGGAADPTSTFDAENPLIPNDQFTNEMSAKTAGAPGDIPLPQSRPWQADAVDTPGGGPDTSIPATKPLGMDDGVPLPPERPATGLDLGTKNTSSSSSGDKTSFTNSDNSKGIFDSLGIKNPLQTGAAAAGLLYTMSQGNKTAGSDNAAGLKSTIPQVNDLIAGVKAQSDALAKNVGPLNEQAQEMMKYVSQGTLPPSYQAQVDAGVKAAKARLTSTYASRGQSTDPTRNSTLAQEMNGIDQQALQLSGQLANQLYQSGLAAIQAANQTQQTATSMLNTGITGIGLDKQTYDSLIKIDQTNAANTSAAIQNFAAALSGGGTKTQSKADSLKNLLS